MSALSFPDIDPVAISLGPFAVRWYALAYIAGLLLGWAYVGWLLRHWRSGISHQAIGDFLTWSVVGIIAGGRLGYVLVYQPGYYLFNPLDILYVWRGGMSFHGGLVGVIVAAFLFARRRGFGPFVLGDALACAAPIGLFFGRIANFVNGELFGRAADVPWAFVFPRGGPQARHPSQLYEAMLEGMLLFVLLYGLARFTRAHAYPGLLAGVFLASYGTLRVIVEFFREPDAHLGILFAGATMGQLLSLPLIVIGLALVVWARQSPVRGGNPAA